MVTKNYLAYWFVFAILCNTFFEQNECFGLTPLPTSYLGERKGKCKTVKINSSTGEKGVGNIVKAMKLKIKGRNIFVDVHGQGDYHEDYPQVFPHTQTPITLEGSPPEASSLPKGVGWAVVSGHVSPQTGSGLRFTFSPPTEPGSVTVRFFDKDKPENFDEATYFFVRAHIDFEDDFLWSEGVPWTGVNITIEPPIEALVADLGDDYTNKNNPAVWKFFKVIAGSEYFGFKSKLWGTGQATLTPIGFSSWGYGSNVGVSIQVQDTIIASQSIPVYFLSISVKKTHIAIGDYAEIVTNQPESRLFGVSGLKVLQEKYGYYRTSIHGYSPQIHTQSPEFLVTALEDVTINANIVNLNNLPNDTIFIEGDFEAFYNQNEQSSRTIYPISTTNVILRGGNIQTVGSTKIKDATLLANKVEVIEPNGILDFQHSANIESLILPKGAYLRFEEGVNYEVKHLVLDGVESSPGVFVGDGNTIIAGNQPNLAVNFSPSSQDFYGKITVSLEAYEENATIYFTTLPGVSLTTNSPIYEEPFKINTDTPLSVMVVLNKGLPNQIIGPQFTKKYNSKSTTYQVISLGEEIDFSASPIPYASGWPNYFGSRYVHPETVYFQLNWKLTSKPNDSLKSLSIFKDDSITFTPDKGGNYQIKTELGISRIINSINVVSIEPKKRYVLFSEVNNLEIDVRPQLGVTDNWRLSNFMKADVVGSELKLIPTTDPLALIDFSGNITALKAGTVNVSATYTFENVSHTGNVTISLFESRLSDVDKDGIIDIWEFDHSLQAFNSADAALDSNNNGLSNYYEYFYVHDTDGDGIGDGYEIENNIDYTVFDDVNSDPDGNGLTIIQEYYYSDKDQDGLSDVWEIENNLNPSDPLDADVITNAWLLREEYILTYDQDQDGISDGYEILMGLDYKNPENREALLDSDGDRLPDVLEDIIGTDRNNPDTDNDDFDDAQEFLKNTNLLRVQSLSSNQLYAVKNFKYEPDYFKVSAHVYPERENRAIDWRVSHNNQVIQSSSYLSRDYYLNNDLDYGKYLVSARHGILDTYKEIELNIIPPAEITELSLIRNENFDINVQWENQNVYNGIILAYSVDHYPPTLSQQYINKSLLEESLESHQLNYVHLESTESNYLINDIVNLSQLNVWVFGIDQAGSVTGYQHKKMSYENNEIILKDRYATSQTAAFSLEMSLNQSKDCIGFLIYSLEDGNYQLIEGLPVEQNNIVNYVHSHGSQNNAFSYKVEAINKMNKIIDQREFTISTNDLDNHEFIIEYDSASDTITDAQVANYGPWNGSSESVSINSNSHIIFESSLDANKAYFTRSIAKSQGLSFKGKVSLKPLIENGPIHEVTLFDVRHSFDGVHTYQYALKVHPEFIQIGNLTLPYVLGESSLDFVLNIYSQEATLLLNGTIHKITPARIYMPTSIAIGALGDAMQAVWEHIQLSPIYPFQYEMEESIVNYDSNITLPQVTTSSVEGGIQINVQPFNDIVKLFKIENILGETSYYYPSTQQIIYNTMYAGKWTLSVCALNQLAQPSEELVIEEFSLPKSNSHFKTIFTTDASPYVDQNSSPLDIRTSGVIYNSTHKLKDYLSQPQSSWALKWVGAIQTKTEDQHFLGESSPLKFNFDNGHQYTIRFSETQVHIEGVGVNLSIPFILGANLESVIFQSTGQFIQIVHNQNVVGKFNMNTSKLKSIEFGAFTGEKVYHRQWELVEGETWHASWGDVPQMQSSQNLNWQTNEVNLLPSESQLSFQLNASEPHSMYEVYIRDDSINSTWESDEFKAILPASYFDFDSESNINNTEFQFDHLSLSKYFSYLVRVNAIDNSHNRGDYLVKTILTHELPHSVATYAFNAESSPLTSEFEIFTSNKNAFSFNASETNLISFNGTWNQLAEFEFWVKLSTGYAGQLELKVQSGTNEFSIDPTQAKNSYPSLHNLEAGETWWPVKLSCEKVDSDIQFTISIAGSTYIVTQEGNHENIQFSLSNHSGDSSNLNVSNIHMSLDHVAIENFLVNGTSSTSNDLNFLSVKSEDTNTRVVLKDERPLLPSRQLLDITLSQPGVLRFNYNQKTFNLLITADKNIFDLLFHKNYPYLVTEDGFQPIDEVNYDETLVGWQILSQAKANGGQSVEPCYVFLNNYIVESVHSDTFLKLLNFIAAPVTKPHEDPLQMLFASRSITNSSLHWFFDTTSETDLQGSGDLTSDSLQTSFIEITRSFPLEKEAFAINIVDDTNSDLSYGKLLALNVPEEIDESTVIEKPLYLSFIPKHNSIDVSWPNNNENFLLVVNNEDSVELYREETTLGKATITIIENTNLGKKLQAKLYRKKDFLYSEPCIQEIYSLDNYSDDMSTLAPNVTDHSTDRKAKWTVTNVNNDIIGYKLFITDKESTQLNRVILNLGLDNVNYAKALGVDLNKLWFVPAFNHSNNLWEMHHKMVENRNYNLSFVPFDNPQPNSKDATPNSGEFEPGVGKAPFEGKNVLSKEIQVSNTAPNLEGIPLLSQESGQLINLNETLPSTDTIKKANYVTTKYLLTNSNLTLTGIEAKDVSLNNCTVVFIKESIIEKTVSHSIPVVEVGQEHLVNGLFSWDETEEIIKTNNINFSINTNDLEDGEYTVKIIASDSDSMSSEELLNSTYIIDSTPPEVSVLTPQENQVIHSNQVVIAFTASDISGIKNIEFKVNNENVTAEGQFRNGYGWYTINQINAGENSIEVSITDYAGLTNTQYINIYKTNQLECAFNYTQNENIIHIEGSILGVSLLEYPKITSLSITGLGEEYNQNIQSEQDLAQFLDEDYRFSINNIILESGIKLVTLKVNIEVAVGKLTTLTKILRVVYDQNGPRLVSWQPGSNQPLLINTNHQLLETDLLDFKWEDLYPGLDKSFLKVESQTNVDTWADYSSHFHWVQNSIKLKNNGTFTIHPSYNKIRLTAKDKNGNATTVIKSVTTHIDETFKPFVSNFSPIFLIAHKSMTVLFSGKNLDLVTAIEFQNNQVPFRYESNSNKIIALVKGQQVNFTGSKYKFYYGSPFIETHALTLVGNDVNHDGIMDEKELIIDFDGNGIIDERDIDKNEDGLVDADIFNLLSNKDLDGDGITDEIDSDRDGDGILNELDPDPNNPNIPGPGLLNGIKLAGLDDWVLLNPLPEFSDLMNRIPRSNIKITGKAPMDTVSLKATCGGYEEYASLTYEVDGSLTFNFYSLPLHNGNNKVTLSLETPPLEFSKEASNEEHTAELNFNLDNTPPLMNSTFESQSINGYLSLYSELEVMNENQLVSVSAPYTLSGTIEDSSGIQLDSIEVRLDNYIIPKDLFEWVQEGDLVTYALKPGETINIYELWETMQGSTPFSIFDLVFGPHTLSISAEDKKGNRSTLVTPFQFNSGEKVSYKVNYQIPNKNSEVSQLKPEQRIAYPIISYSSIGKENLTSIPQEILSAFNPKYDSNKNVIGDQAEFSHWIPDAYYEVMYSGGMTERLSYVSSLKFGLEDRVSQNTGSFQTQNEVVIEDTAEYTKYLKTVYSESITLKTQNSGYKKTLTLADINNNDSLSQSSFSHSMTSLYIPNTPPIESTETEHTEQKNTGDSGTGDTSDGGHSGSSTSSGIGSYFGSSDGGSGGGGYGGGGSGYNTGSTLTNSGSNTGGDSNTAPTSPYSIINPLLEKMIGGSVQFKKVLNGPYAPMSEDSPVFNTTALSHDGSGSFTVLSPSFSRDQNLDIPTPAFDINYVNHPGNDYDNHIHLIANGMTLAGSTSETVLKVSQLAPALYVDPRELILSGKNLQLAIYPIDFIMESSHNKLESAPIIYYKDLVFDTYTINPINGRLKVLAQIQLEKPGLHNLNFTIVNKAGIENSVEVTILISDGDGLLNTENDRYIESTGLIQYYDLKEYIYHKPILAQAGTLLKHKYTLTDKIESKEIPLVRGTVAEPFEDITPVVQLLHKDVVRPDEVNKHKVAYANPGDTLAIEFTKEGTQSLSMHVSGIAIRESNDQEKESRFNLEEGKDYLIYSATETIPSQFTLTLKSSVGEVLLVETLNVAETQELSNGLTMSKSPSFQVQYTEYDYKLEQNTLHLPYHARIEIETVGLHSFVLFNKKPSEFVYESKLGLSPALEKSSAILNLNSHLSVYHHNKSVVVYDQDLHLKAPFFDLNFSRIYRETIDNSPFGKGWFHTYMERIQIKDKHNKNFIYIDETGRSYEINNGNVPETHFFKCDITENEIVFTYTNGLKKSFIYYPSIQSFLLTEISNVYGHKIELKYDKDLSLFQVVYPKNNIINIEYETISHKRKRIKNIRTANDHIVHYKYNSENVLETIQSNKGEQSIFLIKYHYNSEGKLLSQENLSNNKIEWQLHYNSDLKKVSWGESPLIKECIWNDDSSYLDENSIQHQWVFEGSLPLQVNKGSNSNQLLTTYAYVEKKLKSFKTPTGVKTEYTYKSSGLSKDRRKQGLKTKVSRIASDLSETLDTQYDYYDSDKQFALKFTILENGHRIDYEADQYGNTKQDSYTDSMNKTVSTSYNYTTEGYLEKIEKSNSDTHKYDYPPEEFSVNRNSIESLEGTPLKTTKTSLNQYVVSNFSAQDPYGFSQTHYLAGEINHIHSQKLYAKENVSLSPAYGPGENSRNISIAIKDDRGFVANTVDKNVVGNKVQGQASYSQKTTTNTKVYNVLNQYESTEYTKNGEQLKTEVGYNNLHLIEWEKSVDGRYTYTTYDTLGRKDEVIHHATTTTGTMDEFSVKYKYIYNTKGQLVKVQMGDIDTVLTDYLEYGYDTFSRQNKVINYQSQLKKDILFDPKNNTTTTTTTHLLTSEVIDIVTNSSVDDGSKTSTSSLSSKLTSIQEFDVNQRKSKSSLSSQQGASLESESLDKGGLVYTTDFGGYRASETYLNDKLTTVKTLLENSQSQEEVHYQHGVSQKLAFVTNPFGTKEYIQSSYNQPSLKEDTDQYVERSDFDEQGQLNAYIEPGRTTGFKDDTKNRIQYMWRDGKGVLSRYNARGLVSKKEVYKDFVSPENPGILLESESFTYTLYNKVKSHQRRDGKLFEFTYDQANRITQISVDGLLKREYSNYNKFNLPEVIIEYGKYGTIKTMRSYHPQYAYLESEMTSDYNQHVVENARTVSYSYDDFNRVDSITYPTGKVLSYSYHQNQQVESISLEGETVYEASFSKDYPLINNISLGSKKVVYSYVPEKENFALVQSIEYDSTFFKKNEYELNRPFLKKEWQWAENLTDMTARIFDYDQNKRLNSVESYGTWDLFGKSSIQLDKLDTRSGSLTVNGKSKTVVSDTDYRRIASINGTSLHYDTFGGLIEDDRFHFERDVFNRIVKVTPKNPSSWTSIINIFDSQGRRVKRIITNNDGSTNSQHFTYDNIKLIADHQNEYFYNTAVNQPIGMQTATDNTYYHFLTDEKGSVFAVLNDDSIKLQFTYSAWGHKQITDKDTTDSLTDIPFGYNGMLIDAPLSIQNGSYIRPYYDLHFRDYDPDTAQFDAYDPAGYMDGLNLYAAYFGVNGVDPDGLSTIGDYAKRLNKLETQRKELGDTYYYTTRKALYGRIVRLIRTYNAVTNSLSDDKERLNDFLSSFPSVEYYDDSHKTFKSLKSSVLRRASVQTSLNLGLYVVTLGTANKMKAVSTTVKAAEKTSGFLKNSLKANLPYVVFNSSYAGLSSLAQGDEMGLAFKKAGFAALVTTGLRPLILKATPGVSVSVSVEEWIRESILAAVTQFTTKVTFDGWKETLSLKGGVSVFVAAVGGGATKILGTGTITASGFNWTMRLSSTGDAALGVGVGIVLIPVDNYLQNLVD